MGLINPDGTFEPKYKSYQDIPLLGINKAPYFHEHEVPCNCGCGQSRTHGRLIYIANTARTMAGFPFPVTSWNRCWQYNTKIGGADESSHMEGYAMDIGINDPKKRLIAVYCLIEAGAPRIKLRPDHIHFDIDPSKTWGLLLL